MLNRGPFNSGGIPSSQHQYSGGDGPESVMRSPAGDPVI